MPSAPKYHRNKDNLFITTSVEEGLMFPPNALINMTTLSCLAKAQINHPIDIWGIAAAATHAHLGAQVKNPEDVSGFMRYFKTESAHMVNRLLGKKKKTLWCAGYDSPILDTPNKLRQKAAYIFSNPLKDNLEDTLKLYPGINTFEIFKTKKVQRLKVPLLSRTDIEALPKDKHLTEEDYIELAAALSKGKKLIELVIKPESWETGYDYQTMEESNILHEETCQDVLEIEKESREKREVEQKGVIGKRRLIETPIGTPYIPERSGMKTNFITDTLERLVELKEALKELVQQGKDVYEEWKKGNTSIPYPVGLYPPSLPRLANTICS
jgi:REP element-mobilizing transposase RayT